MLLLKRTHPRADFVAKVAERTTLFGPVIASLAQLDCLSSLAAVAKSSGYVRPTITEDVRLHIKGGRHPMVEAMSQAPFVPNDMHMGADGERCMIITGPNMGGKSSYIRQVCMCP